MFVFILVNISDKTGVFQKIKILFNEQIYISDFLIDLRRGSTYKRTHTYPDISSKSENNHETFNYFDYEYLLMINSEIILIIWNLLIEKKNNV